MIYIFFNLGHANICKFKDIECNNKLHLVCVFPYVKLHLNSLNIWFSKSYEVSKILRVLFIELLSRPQTLDIFWKQLQYKKKHHVIEYIRLIMWWKNVKLFVKSSGSQELSKKKTQLPFLTLLRMSELTPFVLY